MDRKGPRSRSSRTPPEPGVGLGPEGQDRNWSGRERFRSARSRRERRVTRPATGLLFPPNRGLNPGLNRISERPGGRPRLHLRPETGLKLSVDGQFLRAFDVPDLARQEGVKPSARFGFLTLPVPVEVADASFPTSPHPTSRWVPSTWSSGTILLLHDPVCGSPRGGTPGGRSLLREAERRHPRPPPTPCSRSGHHRPRRGHPRHRRSLPVGRPGSGFLRVLLDPDALLRGEGEAGCPPLDAGPEVRPGGGDAGDGPLPHRARGRRDESRRPLLRRDRSPPAGGAGSPLQRVHRGHVASGGP